ncbi:MAG: hypothetical protein AMXMBFR13_31680 [Phycisphaerae bacterium]
MPNFSLRRYDTQARFGMIVSLLSAGTLLVLAGLIFSADKRFQYFDASELTVHYGPTRRIAVLAAGGLTALLAALGFGFGLNSAGQRRNDKPLLSWIGFFVGAGVLCLSLVLLYFFIKRGESVIG